MNIICIICSDIIIPSADIYSTQCGHIFHYACVLQWILQSKTCPQCRSKTTEKTLHKLYFNVASTENLEDSVTLQTKLDNLTFQKTLADKDLKVTREKYDKVKGQNILLREEIMELESKMKSHDSIVHGLKDQISFFKSKSRERDKLVEEIAKLKKDVKVMESVQLAISGTREEVNVMLRDENDREALVILAATLKKTLLEVERKKLNLELRFKRLENDVNRYRKEISTLEEQNRELSLNMEVSKASWEKEKDYFKSVIKGSGSENINKTRLLLESPAPVRRGRLSDVSEQKTSGDSPSVEDHVTKILDSNSPYLVVKASNIVSNFIQPSKLPEKSSKTTGLSIFKGSFLPMASVPLTKGTEVACNGLGGQSKEESPFPSGKSYSGMKRSRSHSSASSSSVKSKKLAPLLKHSK